MATEASYVYILSGQKFIKNTKNGQFWRIFEKLKWDIFGDFQTLWMCATQNNEYLLQGGRECVLIKKEFFDVRWPLLKLALPSVTWYDKIVENICY